MPRSDYRRRMENATTALGAPPSQGGLGLGAEGVTELRDDGTVVNPVKEMVGIMSENSVVRPYTLFERLTRIPMNCSGLRRSRQLTSRCYNTFRADLCILNSLRTPPCPQVDSSE